MNHPRPQISRLTAAFSALAITLALYMGITLVRRGGARGPVTTGRCEVTSTVAATTDVGDRALAVARVSGQTIALVGAATGARGEVRVRAVRVPEEGPAEVVYTGTAASFDAISGLVETSEGVAFAVADSRTIKVVVVLQRGPAEEHHVPRGESPSGREHHAPRLALAHDDARHFSLLAGWRGVFGTRRLHTRDVRESESFTPRRRDRVSAPDITVTDHAVLLAQVHHLGGFGGAPVNAAIPELVVMHADPTHPDVLATIALAPEATHVGSPRVAPVHPDAPDRDVVTVWRDEHGLSAARVSIDAQEQWGLRASMRVYEGALGDEAIDVASTGGDCAVAAWREQNAVVVRGFDVSKHRVGVPLRVPTSPGAGGHRVRVEHAMGRVWLAYDSATGVAVHAIDTTAQCEVRRTAVVMPPAASRASLRLVGIAGSATRGIVALTDAPPDAPTSPMVFVTLDARGGVRLDPPPMTAAQGASELALLAGDLPVLVGRARGSVMLLRVGASDDDDEPGEDLLLRDMRGEALAVTASAALHRVWVADLAGPDDTIFGAPNTTVVHSAIDTLEDGPRTEVRPTRVPYAEFARMTLERTTTHQNTVWNTTLSASPTRGESTCVPGAWAARFDALERPIALPSPDARAPEAWMRSLVAEPLRSCDDRVHSASWEQSHLVAIVAGPRLGVRLVTGDVTLGVPRSVALDTTPVLHAGAVRATQGVLAVWLTGNVRSPALRCRYFTPSGEPRGEALTLGEIAEAPTDVTTRDTLPVGGARGRYAALLRTSHGPRVARIDCGE